MKTLHQEATDWQDTEVINKDFVDRFTTYVNDTPYLKAHRDYIEKHAYGFGERAFHWLWKLIMDEMPPHFRFLEIGVYKGQVLSLIRLLADQTGRYADIFGITPLSSFSGDTGKFAKFPDEDYMMHIVNLHGYFDLEFPVIYPIDSTSEAAHSIKDHEAQLDVIYIDGCHEYDYVVSDLSFYPTLLKPGGYLVVDDSACNLKQPWGYFQGIQDVSRAVSTVIETNPMYHHLLAVMHNRVWQKEQ